MCSSKNFNIATNNSVVQVCPDPSSTKLKEIKEALLFPALGARRMATTQCGFPAPLLWGFGWGSAIGDTSRLEGGRERSACLFPLLPPYQVVVSSVAEIICGPSSAPGLSE